MLLRCKSIGRGGACHIDAILLGEFWPQAAITEEHVSNVLMPARIGAVLIPLALIVSACGDTWGQRAVTGGAIGAGAGAAVGAATGGLSVLGGALIGGAVGAGVGAATTPGTRY
jgi:hypothetical protein